MCYPVIREDLIVSKFPEPMEEADNGRMSQIIVEQMLLFKTFITQFIACLKSLKSSRDEMSICRLMVRIMYELRHLLSIRKQVRNQLKLIYTKAVLNERIYDRVINRYVLFFGQIQESTEQMILDFNLCEGNMQQMIVFMNRFHQFSENVKTYDYLVIHKFMLDFTQLQHSVQKGYYERFIRILRNMH